MTIFFATDVHGSEVCFKKLLNAPDFYHADILLLGGDITGKAVQTIVEVGNERYQSRLSQEVVTLESRESLQRFIVYITNMGLYPYVTNNEELRVLGEDPSLANGLFKNLIINRLEHWIDLLEEKLGGSPVRLMVCPGNDDDFFVDAILARSQMIINLNNQVIQLDDRTDIVSLGYSNLTPWKTPRERTEDELKLMIDQLLLQVQDASKCIFNFHVPPINTQLDRCARLDSAFQVVTHLGNMEFFSAGSRAVRESILRYQPILGLFGHIHESRGFVRLGPTLCINPGSSYSEGVLNGCLVTIQNGQIKEFQLTTG